MRAEALTISRSAAFTSDVRPQELVLRIHQKLFLGLTGYYRNCIPNYAVIALPLTDLTKKDTPSEVPWDETHECAFNSLKQRFTQQPILDLSDMTKDFILRTDASDMGVGAVLLQDHDGQLFPISYASKKLSKRERAYATMEKEYLALVWGINKFHIYLHMVASLPSKLIINP